MTGGQSAVRLNDGHSFPMGGLVELSRATYQSTPLTVIEISPKVFSFIGAGGTVTAVGGSHEYAVIDTGYGPRVPEIRRAIANALDQSPRWLIDTHWHFDHTDGNSTFAEDQTTVVGHANCRARMSQDQIVPSLEWSVRSSPRSAWPVLTFNAALSIDLGTLGRDCNHARRSVQDLRGRGWFNATFDFRADVVRRASVGVHGTLTGDSACCIGPAGTFSGNFGFRCN